MISMLRAQGPLQVRLGRISEETSWLKTLRLSRFVVVNRPSAAAAARLLYFLVSPFGAKLNAFNAPKMAAEHFSMQGQSATSECSRLAQGMVKHGISPIQSASVGSRIERRKSLRPLRI